MTVWLVGAFAFLAVVVPGLVVILTLVVRRALETHRSAGHLREKGAAAASSLESLEELRSTATLVAEVGAELARYGRARASRGDAR